MERKLFLSNRNRMFMGVCGGIAEYLNVDPTVVRVVWVIGSALTAGFFGVGIYLVCGFVIPNGPS